MDASHANKDVQTMQRRARRGRCRANHFYGPSMDRRKIAWTVDGPSMDWKTVWTAVLGRSFGEPNGGFATRVLSTTRDRMRFLWRVAEGVETAAWILGSRFFVFQTFVEVLLACTMFFQPCLCPKESKGETFIGMERHFPRFAFFQVLRLWNLSRRLFRTRSICFRRRSHAFSPFWCFSLGSTAAESICFTPIRMFHRVYDHKAKTHAEKKTITFNFPSTAKGLRNSPNERLAITHNDGLNY